MFAAILLFSTAGLWCLPPLLERFGLNGAYFLIAALALLVGFVAATLPEGRVARVDAPPVVTRETWLLASVVLVSILLFYTEQNAVYAYLERFGSAAGLTPQYIGFSLGIASLTGFAGAALIAWIGTRFGRVVPLLIGTALQLGCLALLAGQLNAATYLGGMAALTLAWNAQNPLQLGILAGVDPSGKALAVSATVTGIGLAIGPAAAALVMGGGGYGAILWLAGALALVSLALMLAPLYAIHRR